MARWDISVPLSPTPIPLTVVQEGSCSVHAEAALARGLRRICCVNVKLTIGLAGEAGLLVCSRSISRRSCRSCSRLPARRYYRRCQTESDRRAQRVEGSPDPYGRGKTGTDGEGLLRTLPFSLVRCASLMSRTPRGERESVVETAASGGRGPGRDRSWLWAGISARAGYCGQPRPASRAAQPWSWPARAQKFFAIGSSSTYGDANEEIEAPIDTSFIASERIVVVLEDRSQQAP